MSRLLNKRYIYDVDANNLILKVEKKKNFYLTVVVSTFEIQSAENKADTIKNMSPPL